MHTLLAVGVYITCNVLVPGVDLAGNVYHEHYPAVCRITDNRFMRVGDPVLSNSQPYAVNCNEDKNLALFSNKKDYSLVQVLFEEDCHE